VNIACPFCHDSGRHCGINLSSGAVSCWKCGRHTLSQTLRKVLRVSAPRLSEILVRYRLKGKPRLKSSKTSETRHAEQCELPPGTNSLCQAAVRYLEGRGFDVKRLERTWGLQSTGPLGPYKFRIIAPIYLAGEMVSYQGRDYTGLQEIRYKACAEENESVHHKHTLYGLDEADAHRVVVVEGITDVWRLGPKAVATFGSRYTSEQVQVLTQFREVFLYFDTSDEDAVAHSRSLAERLALLVDRVEVIEFGKDDPGSLEDKDARFLMKELGLN